MGTVEWKTDRPVQEFSYFGMAVTAKVGSSLERRLK